MHKTKRYVDIVTGYLIQQKQCLIIWTLTCECISKRDMTFRCAACYYCPQVKVIRNLNQHWIKVHRKTNCHNCHCVKCISMSVCYKNNLCCTKCIELSTFPPSQNCWQWFYHIFVYVSIYIFVSYFSVGFLSGLTHCDRDKMAAMSQTTDSNAFSRMKMHGFGSKFHWSLFLRLPLTIFQHWCG